MVFVEKNENHLKLSKIHGRPWLPTKRQVSNKVLVGFRMGWVFCFAPYALSLANLRIPTKPNQRVSIG